MKKKKKKKTSAAAAVRTTTTTAKKKKIATSYLLAQSDFATDICTALPLMHLSVVSEKYFATHQTNKLARLVEIQLSQLVS